jgi:predicted phage tail protein
MTYWAQGQLVMQADMPRAQDFDYVFTRSNVIDGKFSYGSASAKTRYTRALVSYDNPANNYDTDVIPFADLDLQRRYGDRPTELSAIGCTRASEAQRRGKWAILSNNQDRTVTFKTGMEGVIPLPGHIIPVADSLLAGREVGGRISVVAGRVITLDRDTQAKAGDRLIINLPGGRAEGRTVQSVSGRAITVTVAYGEPPVAQLQWALDADDLAIPLYRVLRTKRTTEGDYEISALQFEPSKFAFIDTGARLEERPISVIPITVVPAPASVSLSSTSSVVQGLAVATMTISWPAVNGAVGYDVEWRKDSGNWIKLPRTGMTTVDVVGIYAGAYVARVRAVSAFDISSIWRNSILTNLSGKQGLPPAVSYLTATPLLFGIYLKWGFPAGAEDTQRTEIWYGPTTDLEAASKLTDLAYPQSDFSMLGLRAGVTFYFWARLVDRIGNIGPWYPIGIGVQGQSSADAAAILEMIAGEIGRTELGQDILDEIDKIPGLQAQIDALDGLKAYDPDATYEEYDLVVVGKRIYQATGDVPLNTPPPNPAYWLDVGQTVETANGLAQQVATNTADITEIDGVVTAQATAFEALRASFRDDDGEGDLADAMKGWSSTAAIANEEKVRASENLASAQKITTLTAAVGENEASVTDLRQVVATDREATATAITQLTATVGENTSAIQETSEAFADLDGNLSTMWSVKMSVTANGQYVTAGVGLGIENVGGVFQSQFLVAADRFAIVNTIAGGAIAVPFAVQGGQVFINSAFIADGTITNAKIGSYISSTNYIAGTQGWILNKDGTLEINGIVPGQGRLVINSLNVSVYDVNGVLRVRLGYLG